METDKQYFQTVTALSEELHISRKTLYKRAKDNNIILSGSYTSDEIGILTGNSVTPRKQTKGNGNSKQGNGNSKQGNGNSKQGNGNSKQGNTSDSQKVTDNSQIIIELRKQIKNLNKDKLFLQKELSFKNKTIIDANKLADQAQKLQLDLQQKLTQHSSEVEQLKLENKIIQEELAQEKAKSFWQKIFHK